MDEIENAVLSRFESGDKSGPGDRALRWRSCPEPAEVSAITKLCEFRQVFPMARHEARIHAVDAEYD